MASRTFNILSICSGYGCLDLGIGLAVRNSRTVCYVEREVAAAAALAARMQEGILHEAPIWSDINSFQGKPWCGLVDCVASGDPCQGNSVAGLNLGSKDRRSLLSSVIKTIEQVRPNTVFRENVPGNTPEQLQILVPALEEMGYRVAAGIFSAEEIGANHQRKRLFVMGKKRNHSNREKWREVANPYSSGGQKWISENRKGKKRCSKISKNHCHRHPIFPPGPTSNLWPGIIKQYKNLEPIIYGMVDGTANRVDRIRGVGNGVFPMAAAVAFSSLEDILNQSQEKTEQLKY